MNTSRSRLRTALLIFGIWTAYGLFSIYQSFLFSENVSRRDTEIIIAVCLAMCWIWTAFTPVLVWLARRLRLTKETWAIRLPLHVILFVVFDMLDVAIDFLLRPIVHWPPPGRPYRSAVILQMDGNFANYLGVVAITHAVDYQRWFKERRERAAQLELQTAQLEAQLTRARLDALKMQLHPHFLYNTLHAISELIHEDPRAAERMVTHLGELLRMALEHSDLQEVPLHDEIAFIDAYLDIERCRHSDRLTITIDISSDALDALVPHLILQPLVENASRHGVAQRLRDAELRISATRNLDLLTIVIEDNGPGLPNGGDVHEGVGLQNTRARLGALYGDSYNLELSNREGGGAQARLRIPYRPAPPETNEQQRWVTESSPLESRRMGSAGGDST